MQFTVDDLVRLIEKNHFCALATQGVRGPHVAGVGYFANGFDIYVASGEKTRKARNIRRNPRVAVHIPVPWPLIYANQPPPKSIQFRGLANILPFVDARARAALQKAPFILRRVIHRLAERSDTQTFGENIWIHVKPTSRIETFMIGVPVTTVFRDESKAIQHFELSAQS